MHKDKYLVVLAGSPRGGEIAWETLYKYVLTFLEADLAICTGKKFLNNQSFLNMAKYDWSFDEPDEWKVYYDQYYPDNWEEFFLKGKTTGLYESGLIHFAIKDIIYKNYLEIISSYDYIIYTRFDNLYVSNHILGFQDKFLIPEGENYFGIGDRHVIFPSKYAKDFFNILNFSFKNKNLFKDISYLNCETVYKFQLTSFLDSSKILRYKRNLFCVSRNIDKTNWRVAKYKLFFIRDLKIKYPDEFLKSIKNYLFNSSNRSISYLNLVLVINYCFLVIKINFGKLKKLFV